MINYVEVINDRGEVLHMELENPALSGFSIRSITGLGPPKSNIITSQSPNVDGSFFNSARVTSRNIVIKLGYYETSLETIEVVRQKSYRFFPMKVPLTIVISSDNRLIYTIGYVESNEADIFSNDSGTVISIICPDSYFYGMESVLTTFSGVTPNFEFPFENPSLTIKMIEMGIIFINSQANVFYTGDIRTGVTIVVNFLGAVTDPNIHNTTTGEDFSISSAKVTALTGSNFIAGDSLLLSTIRGRKSITLVRNGLGYNILNAVTTQSDWFTLGRGDNVFTYSAASGVNNMQFSIYHSLVYDGV